MGTYRIPKSGERQRAGITKFPPGAPPHPAWLEYIAVKDVDGSTRNARELGAKTLMEPTDIPNIGRFSVIADPTGAAIALFKGM
jgi:predicted enzyme related to lactoylglutathione lyase